MKSIETVWRGYRFRSRLEARWAVFFESLGFNWEYEPEGFVFDDGTCYLPDFRITNLTQRIGKDSFALRPVYIEVKGCMSEEDMSKILEFSKKYHIIVVGCLPDVRGGNPPMFGAVLFENQKGPITLGVDDYGCPCMFFCGDGNRCSWDYANNKALEIARSARFEHGEHPSEQKINVLKACVTSLREAVLRAINGGRSLISQLSDEDKDFLAYASQRLSMIRHTYGCSNLSIEAYGFNDESKARIAACTKDYDPWFDIARIDNTDTLTDLMRIAYPSINSQHVAHELNVHEAELKYAFGEL